MNDKLIQLTHSAKPDFRIKVGKDKMSRWDQYLVTYRKHLIKHGRKAEIRREDGMIALWVNKIA